jgi:hypothetical protein
MSLFCCHPEAAAATKGSAFGNKCQKSRFLSGDFFEAAKADELSPEAPSE